MGRQIDTPGERLCTRVHGGVTPPTRVILQVTPASFLSSPHLSVKVSYGLTWTLSFRIHSSLLKIQLHFKLSIHNSVMFEITSVKYSYTSVFPVAPLRRHTPNAE